MMCSRSARESAVVEVGSANVAGHGGVTSALPALGWLADTVVDAPFDAGSDAGLRRLMTVAKHGIGIPPKTALAIDGSGMAAVLGEGNVATFRLA